jgi:hypothetical protein
LLFKKWEDEDARQMIKIRAYTERIELAKQIFVQWTNKPEFLEKVDPEAMARDAVALADALLARLNER